MNRHAVGWVLLLGAGLGVAACQLVAGIEDVPSSPADAKRDAESDSPSAKDADEGGPVDTRRWCDRQVPKPTYCWDFDVPPLQSDWTETYTSDDVTMTLADAGASSPPYALSVVTNSADAAAVKGTLTQQMPTPLEITVAFDIRALQADDPAGDVVVMLQAGGPYPNQHQVALIVLGDATILQEHLPSTDGGDGTFLYHPLPRLPSGADWSRVEIDVRYGQSEPVARVSYDGTLVATLPITPSFSSKYFALVLGLNGDSRRTNASFLFDNVTAITH